MIEVNYITWLIHVICLLQSVLISPPLCSSEPTAPPLCVLATAGKNRIATHWTPQRPRPSTRVLACLCSPALYDTHRDTHSHIHSKAPCQILINAFVKMTHSHAATLTSPWLIIIGSVHAVVFVITTHTVALIPSHLRHYSQSSHQCKKCIWQMSLWLQGFWVFSRQFECT